MNNLFHALLIVFFGALLYGSTRLTAYVDTQAQYLQQQITDHDIDRVAPYTRSGCA